MTTYTAQRVATQQADGTARMEGSGASWTGAEVTMQGGPAPFIQRGGSTALQVFAGNLAGRQDLTGDAWLVHRVQVLTATLTGRLDMTGQVWVGRFIPISAVYRNADRITLAGIATDLAGVPLRTVQLQFIGETVQQHFFGGSTDANGIYVAFLDVGDDYTAYAYSAGTGIVWRLDRMDKQANTTTLVFRQVTKRGGFGEGIFLQGAS
jgi:hypothetical protein